VSFPQAIINKYHLLDLEQNGFILVDISRGFYILPQVDILAREQVVKHLATHGPAPFTHTPGIWTHSTHNIHFHLVFDDLGIKYINRADVDDLLAALQEIDEVTPNWSGNIFLRMTIAWYYHSLKNFKCVLVPHVCF
jgi:hypothetical protein